MKQNIIIKKSFVLEEIDSLAKQVLSFFKPPQAVLLSGFYGVGKTTFTKALLKQLKSRKDKVFSPAFSILNSYNIDCSRQVHHVDLYRIKNEEDLESTGFWDIFSCKEDLVVIEWADKLSRGSLPPDWNCMYINFLFESDKLKLRRVVVSV